MSRKQTLSAVVSKAAIDPKFRSALVENPKVAAKAVGFDLDDDDVEALSRLKPEEWDDLKVKDLNKRLEEIQMAAIKGASFWVTTSA